MEKGMRIENKRGVKATILSEKIIRNEKGKNESWFDIMIEGKNKVIAVKKIQITKKSWTTRSSSATKKTKEKKLEKARNINLLLSPEEMQIGTLLSIDQSTEATGYSVIELNGTKRIVEVGLIEIKDNDPIKRIVETIRKLKWTITKNIVKAIVIEGIYLDTSGFKNAIANRAKTYEILSYLKNRLIELALEEDIQVIVVPATSWKAYFEITKAGDREKQKEKSIELIENIIGRTYSNDITDSLLLGKYVLENRIKVCNCKVKCKTCLC